MYIYTYIHSYIHTYIHTYLVTVWAAQFSLVRVPPVATLLHSSMISSHHFFVHRLWRLSFLLFGHRQWRPLSLHFIAAFLCAPPVATQLSVLSYSVLYKYLYIHTYIHTYVHTYIHTYDWICWCTLITRCSGSSWSQQI